MSSLDPGMILDQDGDHDDQWFNRFDQDNDPSTLEVNGKKFDLRNPVDAARAHDEVMTYRSHLRNGDLSEYEGRGTDFGDGGRSQLLHDQARAEMAMDFHKGSHSMNWQEQCAEADHVVGLRAAQTHTKWR
jgi:hypothetical protein